MAGIVLQPQFTPPVSSFGPPATGVGPSNALVQEVLGVGSFNGLPGQSNVPSELDVSTDALQTVTKSLVARLYTGTGPKLHLHWKNGNLLFTQRNALRKQPTDKSQNVISYPQLNILLQEKWNKLVIQQLNATGIRPDEERLGNPAPFGDTKLDRIASLGEEGLREVMVPTTTNVQDKLLYESHWALSMCGILARWGISGILYLDNAAGNHTPSPPGTTYDTRFYVLTLTMVIKGECKLEQLVPDATTGDNVFIYLTRAKSEEFNGKVTYGPYQFRFCSSTRRAPPDELLMYRDLGGRARTAWWRCLGEVKDQMGIPATGKTLSIASGWNDSPDYEKTRKIGVTVPTTLKTAYNVRPEDRDPVWV